MDAILDAAAGLIREGGLEGLTVQAIADRAETSKGSMYHFFSDLDSVVRALAERHVKAMQAIANGLREDASVEWARLSADEVIDRVMTPFSHYIDTHPETPTIIRSPANQARVAAGGATGLTIIADLLESVMRVRTPEVPEGELAARASAMVAILHAMKNTPHAVRCSPEHLRTELRRALGAYLGAAERASG